MNCPSCGAPLRLTPDEETYQCEYCRGIYKPPADEEGVSVLGEPSAWSCPVCNASLVQAAIAETRIQYCTTCKGMLVPMAAFVQLVDALRSRRIEGVVQAPADATNLSRKAECPCCHTPMDAHPYAGPGNVVIDTCENCQVNWLDHGELLRIVHAPDSRRPESAPGWVDDYDTAGALAGDALGDFLWSAVDDPGQQN